MKSAMLIPVVGALLLAGCTSGGVSAPSQSPADEKPSTVAVDAAGPRPDAIPEGTWRIVHTRDAANAAGLSPQEITGAIGEGPGATFSLTLAAGRYSTFVAPQRRVPEVGDQGAEVGDKGTYVYREDGALVTTSESQGCPGCVLPITWSIEGDTLSLTLKQEGGVTTDAAERFVIDGAWTRVP